MATKKNFLSTIVTVITAALIVLVGVVPVNTRAASHREAPLISMDPGADITDFFFFRSYEPGREDNVVLIMDVIPGEEPSSGPNYWNFDPNVLYRFSIDNDQNGRASDIVFEFRFKTEYRGVIKDLGLFLSYVALPPITALDGEGSEGLGLRQKYSVTMIKHGQRTTLANDLIAVPSNVGPRTMPDYESLAEQGIYEVKSGDHDIRVFAGQREDPFYIDLGAVFDTLNLRRSPLPLLTAAEDANDKANAFGVDMLSGFNVHTIALEVPASLLTSDDEDADSTESPVLGAYASTSRQRVSVMGGDAAGTGVQGADPARGSGNGDWVQVQRLANPLINETIIPTTEKDRWNFQRPDTESDFSEYYLNPRLAVALETVFQVPAGKTDRTDLVNLLLKYNPNSSRLSELLRLNVSVKPTAWDDQKRLGPLAHDETGKASPDPAAWPNGRRPVDDVTDVAVRVVGGTNYIEGLAGDGINTNDAALTNTFPFLATPFDGVTRVHDNP